MAPGLVLCSARNKTCSVGLTVRMKLTEVAYHDVRNLPGAGDARCTDLYDLLSNHLCNRIATVNQIKHPQRPGIGAIQPLDLG